MGTAPNGSRSLAGGVTRGSVNKRAEENSSGACPREVWREGVRGRTLFSRAHACMLPPSPAAGGAGLTGEGTLGACLGFGGRLSRLAGWGAITKSGAPFAVKRYLGA